LASVLRCPYKSGVRFELVSRYPVLGARWRHTLALSKLLVCEPIHTVLLSAVRFAPEANIGALRASCARRKSVVAPRGDLIGVLAHAPADPPLRPFCFVASGFTASTAGCSIFSWPQASDLRQINPTGKISLNPLRKSAHLLCRLTRQEGRIAIVTNAGWDAVDAAASGVTRDGRAGWRKARERLAACRRPAP